MRALGAALVLALALGGCGSAPAPSAPLTFRLPLVAGAAESLADGLDVDLSVGGGAQRAVEVDTGSRGLVIGRAAIGPGAGDTGRPGRIEYTSDGLVLSGEYFLAPISFRTTTGEVATVPVRVLGVESAQCDPAYPRCTVTRAADEVGVLGVGYGDHARTDGPTSNPFLALRAMRDGTARPGYVITRTGITLGLSPTQSAGFHTVALPRAANGDWGPPPGCFALAGLPPHCGTLLVDTGLGSMIIGLGPAQRPTALATAVPDGTTVRIGSPNLSGPLSYVVTVGAAGDPLAPQGDPAARWAATGPFVNTGRHLLAGYDYLFDAQAGRIGFRADPS